MAMGSGAIFTLLRSIVPSYCPQPVNRLFTGRRRRAHVALMRRNRNIQPYYGRN